MVTIDRTGTANVCTGSCPMSRRVFREAIMLVGSSEVDLV